MFTVPNILTIARMLMLPVIIAAMYIGMHGLALGLYIIASLTDFVDGWWARKFNAVTPLGTFLDPISDKIFVAVILIVLVDLGPLSGLWLVPVLVIMTREFLVSGLREFLGPKNVQMPVTKLAKWKTASQMFALGFLIAAPLAPLMLEAGYIFLLISAALTVITGWGYAKVGAKHLT